MSRWGGAAAIGLAAVVAAVVFLWPQSESGYEPIVYGRDTCALCRMHISNPGFGGELRDESGALTKYDDIGCMLLALRHLPLEASGAWVEDHGGDGFADWREAHFVQGDEVRTPMGYGVVAFARSADATEFARANGARVVTAEALLRDPPDARTANRNEVIR